MEKKTHNPSPKNIEYFNQGLVLAKFFETAPVLMGVVEVQDEDIRHILDNAASAEFFGLTSGSMAGSLASEMGISPANLKLWVKHYERAEREGQPISFEYQHNSVTLSVKVAFIEKSPGGISRFSYIAQDITEMRTAQRDLERTIDERTHELELEKISFQEIANSLPQIIWLARPDGFVYWYSEWYYSYTGLTKDRDRWDEEGISPIHPDDMKQLVEKWTHSLRTGEPTYIYFRVRRSDGEYRWHLSRGIALKDGEGKIVKWVGSNTDIHDNRLLLEKLVEEQDARERFVATLSHDLRTPLTAAKMSAQIIARKATDVDLVTRSSARIVENMNRADVMIRDILDANRIKAGEKIALEFGQCSLRSIISDALDDLRTLHGDRFILIDGQEIEGYWSCSGIRRILENLCNNAIKYGSPHDHVTITLEDKTHEVLLSVQNEGDSIPEDEQKKLFDPYRRAEKAEVSMQRGWGLGLTLVKGIAEAHGGRVTVTSRKGHGTIFQVTLPKNINQN